MKTEETKKIEQILIRNCFGANPALAYMYGTTEVTLSKFGITNGKEIVDFLGYIPKDNTFKCYEIKVSMADLHSGAKLSWYGNWNYLVISSKLYGKQSLEQWKNEVPDHVGIIVADTELETTTIIKRCKKQEIDVEQKSFLMISLVRTLFYQKSHNTIYKL